MAKRKQKQEPVIRRIPGGREVDLSSYQKVRTAAGNTSLDCGDPVAQQLRGKELAEVIEIVARALRDETGGSIRKIKRELQEQYGHLNPGLARMSLGNRLRKLQ